MKRTNFYYPVPLLDRLKQAQSVTGLSVSEMIRVAIEMYLTKIEKRNKP
jgi:predicted DNA-binding protein